ncbi:MAG TPA: hypothetical protein VKT20_04805 [Candidatus Dormibacteraeota bacterium]|nr:hypothetical protein [Candidatus Dormibacteraeota bacterium]
MPDMGSVVTLIYWFVVIAVAINFVNLLAGLLAAVTGRSHMPGFLRRLRRNVAATPDDQRVLGMTLILLSVGQLLMMVVLLVVITLAAADASGGHAPIIGLYLVTLVGFLSSVACTFGSLAMGQRVRYASQDRDEAEEARARAPEVPAD